MEFGRENSWKKKKEPFDDKRDKINENERRTVLDV